MSQGYVSTRTRALNMLIDAGTWVSRDELDALSACTPAVDDALADLVVEGLAEHRENAGYRLAATPAARRAALLLRKTGNRTVAVGQPGKDFYSVGVADTLPNVGLVLYELQVPNPEPGPEALQQHLAQVQGVVGFINSRGEGACTS